MKKYNLSAIMKRAWEFVKKSTLTMSWALKLAWEEAKAMIKTNLNKFDKYEKVARIHNGETNPNIGTDCDSDCNYYTFKRWEKSGYRRIYINDYKRRSLGYIDLNNGNSLAAVDGPAVETAQWFIKNYEF